MIKVNDLCSFSNVVTGTVTNLYSLRCSKPDTVVKSSYGSQAEAQTKNQAAPRTFFTLEKSAIETRKK
jgi:hypothetical protein